ncbi:MAG TPA: hypothetical protein VMT35_16225, partial [Ignavibacteriaceae bacterium]|nr:hypothetical protein [Ignavibacteriaceae bacterium]
EISFFNIHIYYAYIGSVPLTWEYYFAEQEGKIKQMNDPQTRKFNKVYLEKFIDYNNIDTIGNYLESIEFLMDIDIVKGSRKIIKSVRDIPGFNVDENLDKAILPIQYFNNGDSKKFLFYVWSNYSGNIFEYEMEFQRNKINRVIKVLFKGVGDFENVTK